MSEMQHFQNFALNVAGLHKYMSIVLMEAAHTE